MSQSQQTCRVRLITGQVISTDLKSYAKLLSSIQLVGFALALVWFVAIIDVHNYKSDLDAMARVGVWIHVLAVIFAVHGLLFTFYFKNVSSKDGSAALFAPFVTLATAIFATAFAIWLTAQFGVSGSAPGRFAREFPITLALLCIAEFFIARAMISQLLTPSRPTTHTAPKTRPDVADRILTISQHAYILDQVLYIAADGRHVVVHLTDGDTRHHVGFLGDLSATFDPNYGMTVHRSFWVNINAISDVKTIDRRQYCILVNGEQVPIARNRLSDVKDRLVIHRNTLSR